ncbi:MAG: hypothetical protein RMK60_07980 [Burkholderiales bacterium]|nr:hypothetical protein [Burkholderiales bacterium]
MPAQLAMLMFTYDALARQFSAVHYVLKPTGGACSLADLPITRIEPMLYAAFGPDDVRTERGCQITDRKIRRDSADLCGANRREDARIDVQLHEEYDEPERCRLDVTLYDAKLEQVGRFHDRLTALPGLDLQPCRGECARLELLLTSAEQTDLDRLTHAVRVAGMLLRERDG